MAPNSTITFTFACIRLPHGRKATTNDGGASCERRWFRAGSIPPASENHFPRSGRRAGAVACSEGRAGRQLADGGSSRGEGHARRQAAWRLRGLPNPTRDRLRSCPGASPLLYVPCRPTARPAASSLPRTRYRSDYLIVGYARASLVVSTNLLRRAPMV
jgi:hypothetical protein